MSHAYRHALTTVVFALFAAAATAADPSLNSTPVGSGFAAACAGRALGAGITPGDKLRTQFVPTPTPDCTGQTFVAGGVGVADAISHPVGGPVDTAKASAKFGVIKLHASDNGPNPGGFYAGMAEGGWSDSLTFIDPAHTGQIGHATFMFNIDGQLDASGNEGFADFKLFPFENGALTSPGDGFAHDWNVQTSVNLLTSSKTVHLTLFSLVTFKFGTAFRYDVYGLATAGRRAANADTHVSKSTVDFFNTVTFGGLEEVTVGGSPDLNYSIQSTSGMDWIHPVPVPNCSE